MIQDLKEWAISAARKAAGYRRDTLRRIDLAEELRPGRLVFADVGRHQPVQEYLYRIAWWDPIISLRPTVELKFETTTDTLATYGRWRHEGKLDHLPESQVALLQRDCNLVHAGGQSYSSDEESGSVPFSDRFEMAITTCSKTIVDMGRVWGYEDERERLKAVNAIDEADLLVAILQVAERAVRSGTAKAHTFIVEALSGQVDRRDVTAALLALRDAGAAVLFIRRATAPMPTYDMPADLHMIERYPLKNDYGDELVLVTEERVVVAGTYPSHKRPEWVSRAMAKRLSRKAMPTVEEYNKGKLDPFG